MATDYSDLFNDAPPAPAANLNVRFGVEENPDQAAEDVKLARRYKLPVGVVSSYRDDYRQKAQVDDARAVTDQSPKLRGWLAEDTNNAKIAHDDVETLGSIEALMGSLGKAGRYIVSAPGTERGLASDIVMGARSLAAGAPQFSAGAWGAAAYPFEAVGLDTIGQFLRNEQRAAMGQADRLAGTDPNAGLVERGVMSGLRSAGQQLVTLPAGFANATRMTGEQVMLGLMGLTTFGQSYGKARDQGAGVGTAGFYGLEDATAEVVTEKFLGAAKLLGDAKAGMGTAKLLMRDIAREIPGEMGATLWQNFNEWATLNPEKSVRDFLAEQPEALAETVIATIVGGGAQVGAIRATQKIMGDGEREQAKAQKAEQDAKAIEQLQKLGTASKLNARDATTFKQLVSQIADEEGDTPTEFYIDPETLANSLNQSGMSRVELEALMPTVAEQLKMPTGGDIRVPVSEFMAAGEDLTAPLIDHLRTSEDAPTRAEAQEFLKTQGETLRGEVESALQTHDDQAGFRQSLDNVRAQFEGELGKAGRFTPAVNKAYAELLSNFYGAQADRLGMTPEALLDRYQLRVQAQDVAGQRTLNQSERFSEDNRLSNLPFTGASWQRIREANPALADVSDLDQPVTVYRATVGDTIRPDDFVALDRKVAQAELKNVKARDKGGKIISQQVPLRDLLMGNDATEFVYYPEGGTLNQSAVPPAENTTDENGNPEINSTDVRLMFAQPTERFEFIPDPGQQMYNMAIMSPTGDYLGYVELVYENGKPTGLYDIEVNKDTRMEGTGAKVIEAILAANPDQGILISNVVPAARGFWEKVGVPQQNVGEGDAYDGHLDWETYAASPAGQKRLQARGDAQARGGDTGRAEGGGGQALPGVPGEGSLSQGGDQPRAQVHLPADITASPAVISLLAGADLSSFIHESGHFFLEVQADLASRIQQQIDSGASVSLAEQGIVDDMNALLEWFGVKGSENQTPLEEWGSMTLDQKRDSHEQFARGFEAYAMEGKAPSLALQDVFSRFRSWLMQVYKTLRGLNVELNDDVRQVMGRMLASDFAIEEAEAARNMGPLFKTAEEAEKGGMTLAEFNAYQATGQRATDEAIAELQTRGMKDMKWLSRAKDKALKARQEEVEAQRREIRNEVRAEVMAEPVYQAWQFLTSKSEDGAEAGKLRTDELRDRYGVGEDALWRKLSALHMTSDTVGRSPETVADAFGFDSGDALVKALAEAMPPQEVIEARTDQRMLEMFGDITSQEAMERAADEAVHNEVRARFIASELKALAEATTVREDTGKRTAKGARISVDVMAKAAKNYANEIIARLKVREIRPNRYATAEARSSKLAEKALAGGKTAEAAMHKRNQLVNNYATKAAYAAQEEVKKAQAYFRKFDKRSKSIDPEYIDQIEGLLERFDFRNTTQKEVEKRKAFSQWYADQQAQGITPNIPAELLDEANRKNYKDMTLEEIRGLRETVEQIEHLGRLKNRLLTARDQRDFDAAATEMAESIVEHGGKVRPVELEGPRPVVDWFAGVAASHRKLASFFRQMDGNKDSGPMYDYIGRGMNERGTAEDVAVEQATMALRKLYEPITKLKGGITGARSKVFIPEINASLTRGGRLAVALNWGNEANRQRVMSGDKWSEGQVRAILQTLTPTELAFVNGVWEYLDTFWPEVAAKEKRLTGVEPEKVEAVPFTTIAADGTEVEMRGGYYPLKYDTDRSDRADKLEAAQAAKEMMEGAFAQATTRRGHTKARLEEVKRPVRKDLNVITQHVTQVIHDLSWHEWLIDTNRLLNDDRVVSAIRSHYGPKVLKSMRDDVVGIATADVTPQTDIDKALLLLRSNVSRATMGASLTTAFLQPFGLTQSMVRIGPKHVLRGGARWAADAVRMENSLTWIHEKSDFMRLRAKTFNKELREIRGTVAGKSKAMQVIDAGLFALMQKMQIVADVPTWIGQYEKTMAQGPEVDTEAGRAALEEKAVAMADRAVLESQGGGATKDLSEVQRKHPMLTQFYSYFNVTLNLATEQTAATDFKNPAAVAGWLGDMALLLVIPAILPSLMMFAIKGGGDEEDDAAAWAKRIGQWQLGYLMGMVVGVREFGGAVSGFDYAGPPVGRVVAGVGKFGKQVAQGEIDEPLVLAGIDLMGSAFGIPTVQALRSYKGWKAWDEGDEDAGPQSVLFGPPPKK